MANLTPVDLVMPVPPGVSWTDPEKGRPWTQPPKMTNISDVAQAYVTMLSSDKSISSILSAIETKVPLASLAEGMMLTGVARGEHTIDAGILVMPVIIEMLKTVAEIHGSDNFVFPDDVTEDDIIMSDRVVKKALAKLTEKTADASTETPVVELTGLMARKNKEVV